MGTTSATIAFKRRQEQAAEVIEFQPTAPGVLFPDGDVSQIKDIAKQRMPTVGHCIYCGCLEKLEREHIVPLGLSGNAVLQQASCPASAGAPRSEFAL